uniref:Septin-type G domain-containing protein n=1 Tax=Malurus cyaneus samueli TaxID=2593467 RepID=A0A8C5T9U0_9PASS
MGGGLGVPPVPRALCPLQDDKEYVGFATLPNQVHRKSVKKGFDFTLMVAGESGLGKSTLVNSLFLTDMYRDRKLLNAEERITQTVEITKHVVDIEEKGVKLRLTIVDTPGFGDAVNNTECWKPVADYIDQQFEQYFRDESGLNRKNIQDNRVHCCIYFISPFGHGYGRPHVGEPGRHHQRTASFDTPGEACMDTWVATGQEWVATGPARPEGGYLALARAQKDQDSFGYE